MHERSTYVVHRRATLDPSEVEQRELGLLEVRWYWGDALLGARHLRAGERFVVSSDPAERSADLCVDHSALGGDSKVWACIQERAGRWVIALPPALGAGEPIAIEGEALRAFWLGSIEVRVRRVRAGRAASRAGRSDRALLGAFAGAAMLALATVGLMRARDRAWHSMGDAALLEADDERESYVRALIARTQRWSQANAAGASGTPAHSAAGERGGLPSRPRTGAAAPRGGGRAPRRGGASGAPASAGAANAGVLRALGGALGGATINPFAGLSEQPTQRWGASGGVADAFGFAGLGDGVASAGASDGEADFACGCSAFATMGELAMGGLGASGAVAERARHYADRTLRERGTRGPRVCGGGSCAPIVVGEYSSERVRRVVRANIGQIQHCYEQALALDADVAGRVSVRFVISGEGAVLGAAVESNSTSSAPLGACVARVFTRLQFAPPPDATAVIVTFPVQLQRD